jgi:hypothetical protein
MGYKEFALVSMTNKDVYYVETSVAKELMDLIEGGDKPEFFFVRDVKSRATVAIAVNNISSVVTSPGVSHGE